MDTDPAALPPSAPATPPPSWLERLHAYPLRIVQTRSGTVSYREAGAEAQDGTLILLHGIGSGSASWLAQLDGLRERYRVLAWDAPGYGESTPVASRSPADTDYAEALAAWMDALSLERAVFVAHSLGALMAGAFAAMAPERVRGLLLLSPAGGYGQASEAVRNEKRDSRLALLATLGPSGLAAKRSGNLCGPQASADARAWVAWNMARVLPYGYRQATHLLANASLAARLALLRLPLQMAVGADDAVTTPAACAALARDAGVELELLSGLGHACYIEAPERVTGLIESAAQSFSQVQE